MLVLCAFNLQPAPADPHGPPARAFPDTVAGGTGSGRHLRNTPTTTPPPTAHARKGVHVAVVRGGRAVAQVSEAQVCVVTTGCDDEADDRAGARRLVCAEGGASTPDAATTLRACIESTNKRGAVSGAGAQRIEFAAGVTVVSPARALPDVTAPRTTIDGLSAAPGHTRPPTLVRINGTGLANESEATGLVG